MSPTVLITGASQGIGKATALLFARQGYNSVLTSRHIEPLQTVAQEVENLGSARPLTVACDVRNPSEVNTLIQKALAYYGDIDVLINNAGIFALGPVEKFSLDDWHKIIETNLWGYIHTINALLPHFLQRGSGIIVNVSSIGGKVPSPYSVPYCTSKFAVTGLTESLQAELQPQGIQVCGIHPNLIKSSFIERAIFRGKDEQEVHTHREQLNNLVKNPVIEKPEDVANAIWDAVKHKKSEVMVGSANISHFLYRLFPGLTKWVAQQTFKDDHN